MTLIEKYKKYRKIGLELNHKMIDNCLDRDALMKSAGLLGIVRRGTMVFDREEEMSVLMDFFLNEYQVGTKNYVEIYKEKVGGQNEIEKEILDALLSSYTSLFKILSTSQAENTLLLNDILNNKSDIKLTDINFSKTATPGFLLFTRLVPFKDFNATSGVSFAFPGDLEEKILRKYKKLREKVKSDSHSIKRYVSFFKLSRTEGLEVGYE